MGANAQIEVPAFTAGQILTAAEMTQINTGIPVFATTVTRDAAFGGAGEKVLAQGQTCYIEATTSYQTYTGSSWVTFGGGGLVYLTGATFTSQTTVSLPTSTFSSTYRNYKIVFQTTANTSAQDVTMRMRASGTDSSAASYQQASNGLSTAGATNNGLNVNSTSFFVANGSATSDSLMSFSFDLISPQEAARTYFHGGLFHTIGGTGSYGRAMNGMFEANTQFDSLTFITTATNNLTGVYRVYGYANS